VCFVHAWGRGGCFAQSIDVTHVPWLAGAVQKQTKGLRDGGTKLAHLALAHALMSDWPESPPAPTSRSCSVRTSDITGCAPPVPSSTPLTHCFCGEYDSAGRSD
jgi:hypothetical protein